jgi:hypothetical protein
MTVVAVKTVRGTIITGTGCYRVNHRLKAYTARLGSVFRPSRPVAASRQEMQALNLVPDKYVAVPTCVPLYVFNTTDTAEEEHY